MLHSISKELEWYKLNNCTHAHCPFYHEHPQPFIIAKVLYCGKCWHDDKVLTKMVPCTPEVCEDK